MNVSNTIIVTYFIVNIKIKTKISFYIETVYNENYTNYFKFLSISGIQESDFYLLSMLVVPEPKCFFEIMLDNEDSSGNIKRSIYPGEDVKGIVQAKIDKPIKLEKVSLIFNGISKVGFSKKKENYINCGNDYDTEAFQKYESSKDLVKKEIIVYKGKKKETLINPGSYKWPFTFKTDKKWPATVVGLMGKIKYYIVLNADIIEEPRFSTKKKVILSSYATHKDVVPLKKEFLTKIDFPITQYVNKPKKENKIFLEFRLARKSYYMNDTINYKVKLINNTPLKPEKLIIGIKQDTSYDGIRQDEHSGMPEQFKHTTRVLLSSTTENLKTRQEVITKSGATEIAFEGSLEFKNAKPDFNFEKGNIDTKTLVVVTILPSEGEQFPQPAECFIPISIKNIPNKTSNIPPLIRKKICG
ncbi:Arrestin-like, N-terminal domain and Immunoglobulin E-set domain-containing protein [Strongyloides ratti]|uniref:Arrestin-like, N-terminal domain and Immunoglobulin E-set domain-containing protein n=1 Tax=Strongyloides ratti TaxID=34506 RepID=A0A090LEM5_STRRB|nr:Arrestin-like, N-terminal domain and Immunoglobulin E-set domain-containing protein [Strongyloides ratti]CEF68182.1 Arrestin-like, N-terminal domain and Immunoglobulin E-set domain-containing protein [Strongyloides ratti]